MDPRIAIPVVVVLLVVSAFFSSTEIALFSIPSDRIAILSEASRNGATLGRLRSDPHRLLVTILLGNNVVNIAISSIVALVAAAYLPAGQAAAAATAATSVCVLLFGEILPKTYGLANTESWALRVARPVSAISTALYPLVVVFDVITGQFASVVGADPEIEKEVLDER